MESVNDFNIVDILNKYGEITINDISKYNISFNNNTLKIVKIYDNVDDMNVIDFTKSEICNCIIKSDKNILSNNPKKYAHIIKDLFEFCSLDYIYNKFKNSKSYNFDTNERVKDMVWNKKHNFAYYRNDANKSMKDIFEIIHENSLNINIRILLESGKYLHYNI